MQADRSGAFFAKNTKKLLPIFSEPLFFPPNPASSPLVSLCYVTVGAREALSCLCCQQRAPKLLLRSAPDFRTRYAVHLAGSGDRRISPGTCIGGIRPQDGRRDRVLHRPEADAIELGPVACLRGLPPAWLTRLSGLPKGVNGRPC